MAKENEPRIKPKKDAELQRLKKEEQARAGRRRSRQIIGFALSVLVVVGAVSIVLSGVNLVRNLTDTSGDKGYYEELFAPLVWFDVLPFDSVTMVDENTVKQIAIWGVLERLDEVQRDDRGSPMVPALEVDRYGVELFGPDFRFSGHKTFYEPLWDMQYDFNESTQMYTVPATSLNPPFMPTVIEVIRESGGVRRVVMGYVGTRTSDDQMVQTLDYENPTKYLDFMLRRDGSGYYLYAVQANTTHALQNSPSSEALPASSLPLMPDASLPPASSEDEAS